MPNQPKPIYRRVLLKLSGEALMGAQDYGLDPAVVERIAADSTQDPRTLHHGYTVTIRTDRAYLSDGGMRMQVHPGMEAQVELHIGKRSILSYLTDRTTATALRER